MIIKSNKVTPEFLDTLKIKDRAYFISIEDYKGFRIKVNPSGRISFVTYARIKGGGKPRTITHGSKNKLSFPVAIDLHIQSIDLLNKGIDPNLLKKTKRDQFYGSIKFIDLANEYITSKKLSGEHSDQHSDHNSKYLIATKLKAFHEDNIGNITVEKLESWFRNNKHTPAASKNALMLLSKIFKYATATGFYHLQNNPVSELKDSLFIGNQKTSKKQLDLETEYSEYLYNLCDPMSEYSLNPIMRNIIYLMTITGLKKTDILNLKKHQIIENSHININRRKSFIQIVPITDDIQSILDHTNEYLNSEAESFNNDYIFYNPVTKKPITNLRKSFIKISSSFDWNLYPEAIRKSFANICDQVAIPRKHYYQLLGIRESYIPHSDGKLEHEQINRLRDSLRCVQDEINNKCPLIVPGRYNRISDLLYS